MAPASRTPEQARLPGLFDGANSGMRSTACSSWPARDEAEARAQVRLSLQARQAALSTAVSRLLVQNNESDEQAVARTQRIHAQVERNLYIFLARHARFARRRERLPDQLQPPRLRSRLRAVRAPQRTGAAIDLDAGEARSAPSRANCTTSSARSSPPSGPCCSAADGCAGYEPGRLRDELREVHRDRAGDAREGARAFAGAPSGDAGRGRVRERAGRLHPVCSSAARESPSDAAEPAGRGPLAASRPFIFTACLQEALNNVARHSGREAGRGPPRLRAGSRDPGSGRQRRRVSAIAARRARAGLHAGAGGDRAAGASNFWTAHGGGALVRFTVPRVAGGSACRSRN